MVYGVVTGNQYVTPRRITSYLFGTSTFLHNTSTSYNTGDKVKFIVENGSVAIYKNNTLLQTITGSSTYSKFRVKTYNNRGIIFKNLKIKPL